MAEEVVADPFFTAKYYDCKESERLTHESAEEAIVDFFEGYVETGHKLRAIIEECCPFEVVAYEHLVIDDDMLLSCSEDALEAAVESLSNYEDYWDPDGDGPGVTREKLKAVAPKMLGILRELFEGISVWGCTVVARRNYNLEEIVAILREDDKTRFPEDAE